MIELRLPDGLDGQSGVVDQHHLLQRLDLLDLREGHDVGEFLDESHVDHVPTRILRVGLRVEVLALLVEREVIRVGLLDHLGDADYPGRLGLAVVEQHFIALRHGAHVVPRLVVPDAVPAGSSLAREVVDGVGVRLALHEPVASRSH